MWRRSHENPVRLKTYSFRQSGRSSPRVRYRTSQWVDMRAGPDTACCRWDSAVQGRSVWRSLGRGHEHIYTSAPLEWPGTGTDSNHSLMSICLNLSKEKEDDQLHNGAASVQKWPSSPLFISDSGAPFEQMNTCPAARACCWLCVVSLCTIYKCPYKCPSTLRIVAYLVVSMFNACVLFVSM